MSPEYDNNHQRNYKVSHILMKEKPSTTVKQVVLLSLDTSISTEKMSLSIPKQVGKRIRCDALRL